MNTSTKFFFLIPFFIISFVSPLWSGSGSITPAPSNTFGIRGLMNFTVNFRSPPSQTELDLLETELAVANGIICDATDGQIVFGTITVTSGSVNESLADMWIFPQTGRAGLSLFLDGSSLKREGGRITMFSNSINGVVIAHELGHLAFGILDEYSEQCRWGGPCGIGQCLEAGIIDDQNASLMQQTPNATELCVPANHDLVRGDGAGCPATTTCSSGGMCTDPNICAGFNGATNRFELSQQTLGHGDSGWETLVRNMTNTYGVNLIMPAGLPVAAPPANCDAFLTIDFQVGGTDLVVLTMDKSASMNIQDVGDITRLEFTQAAARGFLDLQSNNNIGVGIVCFNSTADVVRSIETLNSGNLNSFKADIDGITASGNTAIGEGMYVSAIELEVAKSVAEAAGNTVSNPTIFLLSDGQNNRGAEPEEIAELLIDRGITLHTISAGDGADTDLLSDIATATGGNMLPARTDDLIPPTYAEFSAKHQGMSMLNVIDINTTFSTIPGVEFGPNIAVSEITFLVEEGVEELVLYRSLKDEFTSTVGTGNNTQQQPYDSLRGVFNYLGFFNTPEGFSFIPNATRIIDTGNFYEIIKIKEPTPGVWSYFVERFTTDDELKFHFRGFINNVKPDYYIDAFPPVVNTMDTVIRISADATFSTPLSDPSITYEGYVVRPDNSRVDITFDVNPITRAVSANFNAFNGRGLYKVFSEVNVPTNATFLPGEIIFDGPELQGDTTVSFGRIATSSFFVNVPGCPACQNEDCDGDGIPNNEEDAFGDIDGDGLPNRCDEDSDGDDIPDKKERLDDLDLDGIPDSYDPADPMQDDCDLTIKVISIQNPDCGDNNGRIEIEAIGGNGKVTYNWGHDLMLNSNIAGNLSETNYFVNVVDEAGCAVTEAIFLDINCEKPIQGIVECPGTTPENCDFPVVVKIDMSGTVSPDTALGSFTAVMTWNPAELKYVGPASLLANFNGFINLDEPNGKIIFNGANANGQVGIVPIFETYFQAIGSVGTSSEVKVELITLAAAHTFNNLLPVEVESCEILIIPDGLLGDVNGDGLVNSTDGNIVLSYDAGLPVNATIQSRINDSFGDVNRDGNTDAIDALIILTYDALLPVPYPVGEFICSITQLFENQTFGESRSSKKVEIWWEYKEVEQTLEVPIAIDMSPLKQGLGSYKLSISWNPAALKLLSFKEGLVGNLATPILNDAALEKGRLVLTNAQIKGGQGLLNLANLKFARLSDELAPQLELDVSSLATSGDFVPLKPVIKERQKWSTTGDYQNTLEVAPNPFKQDLSIHYKVAKDSQVEISVFNVMGQSVATLTNNMHPVGDYTVTWYPEQATAGLYIIQAKIGEKVLLKKVVYSAIR